MHAHLKSVIIFVSVLFLSGCAGAFKPALRTVTMGNDERRYGISFQMPMGIDESDSRFWLLSGISFEYTKKISNNNYYGITISPVPFGAGIRFDFVNNLRNFNNEAIGFNPSAMLTLGDEYGLILGENIIFENPKKHLYFGEELQIGKYGNKLFSTSWGPFIGLKNNSYDSQLLYEYDWVFMAFDDKRIRFCPLIPFKEFDGDNGSFFGFGFKVAK